MWLVCFVTAGFWAGYELIADWLDPATSSSDSRHLKYWRLAFYLALAFAFLAKGPLGWMPLLTVAVMKFFLRGQPLNRRFWFAAGMLFTFAIVCSWGIPALVRTKGEFFWVGIGRHVVERSFGAMEGHGGQTLSSYFLTLPFYFVTVFVSFFPWSIKLPALTKRLWRERDGVDRYLICGTAIIFLLMTVIKTKLPHYTLTAFPLLSLLLARHLFALPGSPRFACGRPWPRWWFLWQLRSLAFRSSREVSPRFSSSRNRKKISCRECILAPSTTRSPAWSGIFEAGSTGFSGPGKPEHVKKYMAYLGTEIHHHADRCSQGSLPRTSARLEVLHRAGL